MVLGSTNLRAGMSRADLSRPISRARHLSTLWPMARITYVLLAAAILAAPACDGDEPRARRADGGLGRSDVRSDRSARGRSALPTR